MTRAAVFLCLLLGWANSHSTVRSFALRSKKLFRSWHSSLASTAQHAPYGVSSSTTHAAGAAGWHRPSSEPHGRVREASRFRPWSSIKSPSRLLHQSVRGVVSFAFMFQLLRRSARASVPIAAGAANKSSFTTSQGAGIWLFLFLLSAALHSAESAITKISPWKVQQFAEEEGEGSPFATLSGNLTRLLSTILLTTTACSIYSTALFVTTATELFPQASLGVITAALTCVTLFFGELLPKALAVNNSELVARKCVPILSRLAACLIPITATVTFLSDLVLQGMGMRSKEDRNVSEDMLRMVVDEAQRTEGIATGEGRMIKAVLDLQDNKIDKIMQPRIDIVAVPEAATATEILRTFVATKYSRIPVYRQSVDNVVGVIFSKDLLFAMELPEGAIADGRIPQLSATWASLSAAQLMEPTYFIPETMTTWNALQEMRRRRVHMAIVVDEYGGTSGLVTFEDILEEVVGEIYDEDDDDEDLREDETIFKRADNTFEIKGYAELDNVCEALGLGEIPEENAGEYTTIGGLLCSIAGEIPVAGDEIAFAGYKFTIREVDNRKIISLTGVRVEGEDDDNNNNNNNKNERGSDGRNGDRDRDRDRDRESRDRDRESRDRGERSSSGGADSSASATADSWSPGSPLGEGKQLLHVVRDESAASGDPSSAESESPVEILTFVDGSWVKENTQ